jgi:metal-responsive CopG/Arc/MetJ family transcriptional regulator
MTVQIEIDEKVLAEVDEAIEVLRENRDDVFREAFGELARKKKKEAEIARQYREAYRKNPVQPDEFYVEEEQLIEAWKDL